MTVSKYYTFQGKSCTFHTIKTHRKPEFLFAIYRCFFVIYRESPHYLVYALCSDNYGISAVRALL